MHTLSNYSNGTLYSHITKSGIIGSLSHHYVGRTRTDANSPSNYYSHGLSFCKNYISFYATFYKTRTTQCTTHLLNQLDN